MAMSKLREHQHCFFDLGLITEPLPVSHSEKTYCYFQIIKEKNYKLNKLFDDF